MSLHYAVTMPPWAVSIEGWVRLEHLGPPGREFKVVKLAGGRRVLVDQAVHVVDPFQAWTRFLEMSHGPLTYPLRLRVEPLRIPRHTAVIRPEAAW